MAVRVCTNLWNTVHVICFFHCKNDFVRGKRTKIIFTNIVIWRKFFWQIFRRSALKKIMKCENFLHKFTRWKKRITMGERVGIQVVVQDAYSLPCLSGQSNGVLFLLVNSCFAIATNVSSSMLFRRKLDHKSSTHHSSNHKPSKPAHKASKPSSNHSSFKAHKSSSSGGHKSHHKPSPSKKRRHKWSPLFGKKNFVRGPVSWCRLCRTSSPPQKGAGVRIHIHAIPVYS